MKLKIRMTLLSAVAMLTIGCGGASAPSEKEKTILEDNSDIGKPLSKERLSDIDQKMEKIIKNQNQNVQTFDIGKPLTKERLETIDKNMENIIKTQELNIPNHTLNMKN